MKIGDEYLINRNFWDDKGLLHHAACTVRIRSVDLNSDRVEFVYLAGVSPPYCARTSVFISNCTLVTIRVSAGSGNYTLTLPPLVQLSGTIPIDGWGTEAETVPAMNIDSSIKCECGSHSVGIDKHSDYCPRYVKS